MNMSKKKKDDFKNLVPAEFVSEAQLALTKDLEENLKYSLLPDPTGELGLTDEQKTFIEHFIDVKNIPAASNLTGIPEQIGREYYFDASVKSEIARINRVMYLRKFNRRLLTIDEIGGYLTSMLIDEDVPLIDKLDSKDKLKVAQMIIDLNKTKQELFNNPEIIEVTAIENEIKSMDVSQIKDLINKSKNGEVIDLKSQKENEELLNQKEELISQINKEGLLDPNDLKYLRTCSIKELNDLLEKQQEKGEK